MTQLPQNAAPGWYPDNHNPAFVRWWDGAQWTDHVQPAAVIYPQPMPVPIPAAPVYVQQPTRPAPPPSKRARIKENRAAGVACCPKCGSTSLSANQKGFRPGRAVAGAVLTGGIGLVAGGIGAKKVEVTCLNCGHKYTP